MSAVTRELVLRELRAHDFAVLSTADAAGRPCSAGVTYRVSPPGRDLALYVMTRRHLAKARNIARDPRVALVVPVPRRILWPLPPATMQVTGTAELLERTDQEAREVFRGSWLGRRIVRAYEEMAAAGETRVCFVRIVPDPEVRTYMVGVSIWAVRSRMGAGSGKARIR